LPVCVRGEYGSSKTVTVLVEKEGCTEKGGQAIPPGSERIWKRAKYGRTKCQFANGKSYERERPKFVSLDDPKFDQLGGAVAGVGVDEA
jgi:hypothetical protein